MRTTAQPRGSALIVAMILLAVLSVIGAAAVMLSSQERQNAATQVKLDFVNACANAAQAKIWAEMSQYGFAYLGSSSVAVSSMTLPDGTRLTAPAHYGFDPASPVYPVNVTFKAQSAGSNTMNERDCTNGACGITPLGQVYGLTAVCKDAHNREYEVELAVKFAL